MSKNQIFNPLRAELLAACLVEEEYQQANGAFSNNKLVVERLQDNPELSDRVVQELGWLATSYNADLLLPIPSGANWLARAVSLQTGIDYGLLLKSESGIITSPEETQEKLVVAQSVVILEDVLNRLTTTKKVLTVPGVSEKTVAVIGVFDRGPATRDRIPVPVQSLLRRPIPDQLPKSDKLWRLTRKSA